MGETVRLGSLRLMRIFVSSVFLNADFLYLFFVVSLIKPSLPVSRVLLLLTLIRPSASAPQCVNVLQKLHGKIVDYLSEACRALGIAARTAFH